MMSYFGFWFEASFKSNIAFFLILCMMPDLLFAENHSPGRLERPKSNGQNFLIENSALTIDEFWNAYRSQETDSRRRAEIFLTGLLDATEQTIWCDYKRLSTITIDEVLASSLKKLYAKPTSGMMSERASKVIKEILHKRFPCPKSKSS